MSQLPIRYSIVAQYSWPHWLTQQSQHYAVSEGSTNLRAAVFFGCRDLDLESMTLKLDRDTDMLMTDLHTENEVAGSSRSKVIAHL